MNKIVKNMKKNTGSVTLYVLLAVLFFIVIAFSFFYISQNKKEAQEKEYLKIKSEYEKDINLEQEYVDTTKKILITLKYDGTEDIYDNKTWTNKNIRADVTYPSLATNKKLYSIINNKQITNDDANTALIEENQIIKAEADLEGKKIQANRDIKYIDKIAPEFIQGQNEISKNSITLNFNIKDLDSGLKSVKIIKDGEIVETIEYNFNQDTFSGSKEENIKYILDNLKEKNTYKIKYEIEDYAGNIIKTEEKQITTVSQQEAVAQIVEINGETVSAENSTLVGENIEYPFFTSLKNALEYCKDDSIEQCKIKMLKYTKEETNTIEKNKKITIDLAGNTIESELSAFIVRGDLTILDTGKQDAEINTIFGKVQSNDMNTIQNFGTLTLGEYDYKTPLEQPVITVGDGYNNKEPGFVAVYIENEATLNFNDGILKSSIGRPGYQQSEEYSDNKINKGVVTPTYASVTTYDEDKPHWFMLKILGDPVAKLGTKTYLTVQDAIDAAEEGQGTETIEVDVPYVEQFQKNNDYYFKIDSAGNLVSNNQNKDSTTANSYLEIDLKGMEGEHTIVVNASISSESGYDKGYAIVTKTKNAPNVNTNTSNQFINRISGEKEAKDYETTLEGGDIYYLHIGYFKDGSKSENQDSFKIHYVTIDGEETNGVKKQIQIQKRPEIASEITLLGTVNPVTGEEAKQTITESINIPENKNIQINLQGNSLKPTEEENKYVIENYGKLQIINTDEAGKKLENGEIYSNTYSVIYNHGDNYKNAELELSSGTIKINAKSCGAIINEGKFTMTGGTVTIIANKENEYGIANYGKECEIKGGKFISEKGTTGNYYASKNIRNVGSGIINVGSGIINVENIVIENNKETNRLSNNDDKENNAIINESNGTINIKNSNITVNNGYIIRNKSTSTGTINIESCTINGKNSYGIWNIKGTINISGTEDAKTEFKELYTTITTVDGTDKGKIYINNNVNLDSQKIINYGNEINIDNINCNKINIENDSGIINIKNSKMESASFNNEKNNATYNLYNNKITPNSYIDIRQGTFNLCGANSIISNNGERAINLKYDSTLNINNTEQLKNNEFFDITETDTIKGDYIESTVEDAIDCHGNTTINIGIKDGKISTTDPEIKGKDYGIYTYMEYDRYGGYNEIGVVNFYDGIIKGGTEAYSAQIKEIEDNAEIIFGQEGIYKTATLGTENENPVAKIGENLYYKLQDATDACPTDGTKTTIEILRNINQRSQIVTKESQDIVLDLASYTIQNDGLESMINNNCNLEIVSNLETKGIIKNVAGNTILENNAGNVTLRNVEINLKFGVGIIVKSGNLYVSENTTINLRKDATGIQNEGTGLIEVEKGSQIILQDVLNSSNTTYSMILNKSDGTVKITGGELKKENNSFTYGLGIKNEGKGTIEVTSGLIDLGSYGKNIYIPSGGGGTIKVSGGTIGNNNGYEGIDAQFANNCNIEITGGTIASKSYPAIYASETTNTTINENSEEVFINGTIRNHGTLNIEYATITSSSSLGAIYNAGEAIIEDVHIETNNYTAIYAGSGTLELRKGYVKTTKSSAIEINSNDAILKIGIQGEPVEYDSPHIISTSSMGVEFSTYSPNGKLHFYDGKIYAPTTPIRKRKFNNRRRLWNIY